MVMLLVCAFFLEKVRIDVELGIQVETAQVKHLGQRHIAKMHRFLGRARVHVFEAVHQRVSFCLAHQIGLADEQLVGKPHLAARLLAVVELLGRMFGIDQRQDGVEQVAFGDFIVHEKSLRHRAGVGQTGGLYHHPVKIELALAFFFGQIAQRRPQVFADGAANAAIAHLDDVFSHIGHQNFGVDVFLAKFVFDHGNFLAVGFGEHPLEQGGFSRAEKARQNGGRDETHGDVQ